MAKDLLNSNGVFFERSWFETDDMKVNRIPASVFDLESIDGLDTLRRLYSLTIE